MSDRPEEARPPSEGTGGWFVPKNAMSEQELANAAKQETAGGAQMPGDSPQQSGAWYTPPEAKERAAAITGKSGDQPAADGGKDAGKTAEKPGQEINLPAGAAVVSGEIDYSNYVPGKGFVPKAENPTTSGSAVEPQSTGAQPRAEPTPESQSPGDDPSSVYTPQGQATPTDGGTKPEPKAEPAPEPANAAANASASAAGGAEQPAEAQSAEATPDSPELLQRYEDVEKAVQTLRRKYSAGTITRSQLQDELRKLMILDGDGYWWMIGLESDRWYKYNGKDWTPAVRPGKSADEEPAPAVQPATGSGAQGGSQPIDASSIPLDEYGMPLPQRVPINDPGATMVGMSAPRLDNTLKGPSAKPAPQPSGPPKYFERASRSGTPAFDGGLTMPSGGAQLTQPGRAVSAGGGGGAGSFPGAARIAAGAGAAAPAVPMPGAPPGAKVKIGEQPDYGAPPKGFLADRQRAAGCLIRLAIVSVFLALIGALVGIGILVLGYFSIINQYDTRISGLSAAVTAASQSAQILDKNGRLLYQLNDPNLGARIMVPLNQISPYLIAATVRVEDQRFYDNPGFDVIGIARAILQNLRAGEGVTGASSITQQLARALVLDPGAAQDRSARRKIVEIIVSSEIARRYSKSQILEYYLNTVYYGNLAYGAEAASQTYFQKSAKTLNIAEAAFLAGLVQSPATYDPVVNRSAALARMDDVLKLLGEGLCLQMEHAPYNQGQFCIGKQDLDAAIVLISKVKAQPFKPAANNAIYPHFVNYVEQQLEDKFGKEALYSSGFRVYTTIDPQVQDIADQAVKQQIGALKGRNVTNGAVLAVRPADGAILAMVGSADFNNKDINGQFNVTLAARQPGSSIKPFVYLASFERDQNNNYFTPATILWDVPSCFGNGTQSGYCPVNYDGKFNGPISVRFSLSNSINLSAVKTLQYVGVDRFKALAARLGVHFPLTQPEQAGLAMALGGVEVPLIDMVHGYSVLANSGKSVDFYSITKVTRKNGDKEDVVFEAKDHPMQQVVEPGLAYLVTSIMSDQATRRYEFGTALDLPDGRPAAVKTGTTNDFKDNWTIGFTPQLVVGVWVGNSDNSPMIGTSGVTGAAPIWKQVMVGALAGQPKQAFPPGPNDQQATVCDDYGTLDFPDCPKRRPEVFFAPNPPPPPGDLFKTIQVDSFSGLIANNNCPDYVENRTFLTVNDPTAIAWLNNDTKGQAWAQAHKLSLPIVPPPTQACDPNTPRPTLRVTTPQPNSSVGGLVEVRGSVSVPGFNRYQIEIGQGLNATQFEIVDGPYGAQPQGDNSFLGRVDTTTRQNGAYTLRLWAVDGQGHHAQVLIPLIVNNLSTTAIPTQPPVNPATPTPQVFPQGPATATPIIINPAGPTPIPITGPTQPPPTQAGGLPPTNTLRPIFPPTSTP